MSIGVLAERFSKATTRQLMEQHLPLVQIVGISVLDNLSDREWELGAGFLLRVGMALAKYQSGGATGVYKAERDRQLDEQAVAMLHRLQLSGIFPESVRLVCSLAPFLDPVRGKFILARRDVEELRALLKTMIRFDELDRAGKKQAREALRKWMSANVRRHVHHEPPVSLLGNPERSLAA